MLRADVRAERREIRRAWVADSEEREQGERAVFYRRLGAAPGRLGQCNARLFLF